MNQMRNLFGMMGGGGMSSPLDKFRQFMQNPIAAMMGNGINIPPNIQNNPEAIVNYMRSSGQMTDAQYNQVAQMAQMAQSFMGNGR